MVLHDFVCENQKRTKLLPPFQCKILYCCIFFFLSLKKKKKSVRFISLTVWIVAGVTGTGRGGGGGAGHRNRVSTDPVPVFSAGSPSEQFWRGQGSPFFFFNKTKEKSFVYCPTRPHSVDLSMLILHSSEVIFLS